MEVPEQKSRLGWGPALMGEASAAAAAPFAERGCSYRIRFSGASRNPTVLLKTSFDAEEPSLFAKYP